MRIICAGPYDFALSWRLGAAYGGNSASERGSLAMWWDGKPTSVLLRQTSLDPPIIELIVEPMPRDARRFGEHMRGMLNAELALEPFYRKARRDKALHPLINAMIGLKPVRPPDIFQMLVIAVTEQQISLSAASSIRGRLVSAYGTRAGRLTAFPRPQDIANVPAEELASLGLSRRKAEYIVEFARALTRGDIDPAAWSGMPDEELAGQLRELRGIGEWTAEYLLLRGLGRMDAVPASDLGIRRVLGMYMGGGGVVSEEEARRMLKPWSPWRGLLAFYLLSCYRRSQMGLDQAQ